MDEGAGSNHPGNYVENRCIGMMNCETRRDGWIGYNSALVVKREIRGIIPATATRIICWRLTIRSASSEFYPKHMSGGARMYQVW